MTAPDQPQTRPIAIALIAMIAGIALSAAIVRLFTGSGGGRTDIVTTNTFEQVLPQEAARLARVVRLHLWTWADPEHRRVRMPIERAIDRYLAGAR